MKPCEVCGLRECNHRVPEDLKEEIGEGYDEATLDAAYAAADEYYSKSKKTVFVPVEVEYHEPTDTIFSFKLVQMGECVWKCIDGVLVSDITGDTALCPQHDNNTLTISRVEKALRDNPARKLILDEIKLYKEELADLGHQSLSSYELAANENTIMGAIKALNLLANKF